MKNLNKIALSALLASCTLGCQFHARSADDFQKETTGLLDTKHADLKGCYDGVLAKDSKAAGVVAVNFNITPKTGEVVDVTIDSEKSTAPEPLQKCVLDALVGLSLDPPDKRQGVASFSYEFTANSPKQG